MRQPIEQAARPWEPDIRHPSNCRPTHGAWNADTMTREEWWAGKHSPTRLDFNSGLLGYWGAALARQ